MWAREVALSIAAASALLAGVARAQTAPDEAQAHFDRGAALAAEQKYDEAGAEFRASYELKPRKESLFAWAQVLRLGGDCPGAVELYQRFLRSADLTPTQIEAAQLSIERCQNAPPPAPRPPAPPPEATPAPVVVVAAPAAPVVTRRSGRAVAVGAGLLAGSVLALGASGTFFYLSESARKDAQDADSYDAYKEPAGRARSQQRWALGLLGAGVVLGGGAVLEWLVTAPGKGTTTAGLWIGGGGAGVGLRGTY